MRSESDVGDRYLLKYASYPDVQENSLRVTDSFALGLESLSTIDGIRKMTYAGANFDSQTRRKS